MLECFRQVGLHGGHGGPVPHRLCSAVHALCPHQAGRLLVRAQRESNLHQFCFHRYVSFRCVCVSSFLHVGNSVILTHSYSLTHSANPIGIAVAQLASPYIVTSTDKLPMMVLFITIVCIHLSLLPHFMKIFKYTHLPTFLFPPLRTHSAVDLHGASRCGSIGDRRGLLVEQATPPPYPHLRG